MGVTSAGTGMRRGGRAWVAGIAVLGSLVVAGSAPAQEKRAFPTPRTASRSQAESALTGAMPAEFPCLTPRIHALERDPAPRSAAGTRALAWLRNGPLLTGEPVEVLPDGSTVWFTTDPLAADRIDPTDRNRDGLPDVVERIAVGLALAKHSLVDGLGLPSPPPIAIVLARLRTGAQGYLVHRSGTVGDVAVIDASPAADADAIVRSVVHQYTHAVSDRIGSDIDPAWAEAFATWATARILGSDDPTIDLLERRRESLAAGLRTDDPATAAGNALWFYFLDEAYGPHAVRATLEALEGSRDLGPALDGGLRRATGQDLDTAFRDFQLWVLLTGRRDDGRHLSVAGRFGDPGFAATSDWLPAISVHSDPPIADLGSTAIRIAPDRKSGGMTVRFEGGEGTAWAADVLLVRADGTKHRVPLALSADGRGEVALPLDDLAEAILLVRNVGRTAGPARPYTWSAHAEPGYPYDLASLRADAMTGPAGGVLVSWETDSEHRLVGFNVVRTPVAGGISRTINPVWVPAIGDLGTATAYQFLDGTAEPGRAYRYRIEGITLEGLNSRSAPVTVVAPTD